MGYGPCVYGPYPVSPAKPVTVATLPIPGLIRGHADPKREGRYQPLVRVDGRPKLTQRVSEGCANPSLALRVSMRPSIFPHDTHQHAQDVHAIAVDRFHCLVGGLETDPILLAKELLERCLAVVVAYRDDLAVASLLLPA